MRDQLTCMTGESYLEAKFDTIIISGMLNQYEMVVRLVYHKLSGNKK